MGASYKAEAVVLRSLRLGEADRVLHLYTRERGRVGAVAKGVRRTSRASAPGSSRSRAVALILHEGRGELHTVSAAEIVESTTRPRGPLQAGRGLVALEAVSRLFAEGDPSPKAYRPSPRFLSALSRTAPPAGGPPARARACWRCSSSCTGWPASPRKLDACASCGVE